MYSYMYYQIRILIEWLCTKWALERLLLTLKIWLFRFAWIADCHNCLLVLQVAGVFWVAKKVSIFNSSILPSYFSSCSSLSATQDCWFNQFPGQQYFAQWELQLMILFWMNMNLFKRKQYIVFCIEKSIVCGMAVYFVLTRGDLQRREWTFCCSVMERVEMYRLGRVRRWRGTC